MFDKLRLFYIKKIYQTILATLIRQKKRGGGVIRINILSVNIKTAKVCGLATIRCCIIHEMKRFILNFKKRKIIIICDNMWFKIFVNFLKFYLFWMSQITLKKKSQLFIWHKENCLKLEFWTEKFMGTVKISKYQ